MEPKPLKKVYCSPEDLSTPELLGLAKANKDLPLDQWVGEWSVKRANKLYVVKAMDVKFYLQGRGYSLPIS
jgi:hypothetical protein